MEKSYPRIYISREKGDKNSWTFDVSDIMTIINLDLATAYQTKGQDIYIQKNGCPMGGLLSAIYANIKCAYDEVNFIHRIGMKHNKFFGIRQMDDLILWIAYTKNDKKSYNEALLLKNTILTPNKVYTGGLELEEQDYVHISDHYTVHKFAGTVIHCHYSGKVNFIVHTLIAILRGFETIIKVSLGTFMLPPILHPNTRIVLPLAASLDFSTSLRTRVFLS